jgi:UDP-GlcNAc3NAcA epimerase
MKILTVIGARPQFIKASAVSRAISRNNFQNSCRPITEVLLHTGQHYDYNMSQVFFDQLRIPAPQYHLDVRSGSHGEMTGAMLSRIEPVMVQEKPDWVMVYGDTNSTLAGALTASKLHIPVVHIESGLRSFNRRMPEEINRVLTDHVSSLLFCPTEGAVHNLRNEGIEKGVFQVGDVMYDSFLFCRGLALKESTILSTLGLQPKSYCLATVHRQENADNIQSLENIFGAFEQLASADCPFVVPIHPRTQKNLIQCKRKVPLNPHLHLISPVGYFDMIALEAQARVILTDSGGVQKEAYFSYVPCVTLRNETEWVETVEAGWNHIAGAGKQPIVEAFNIAIGPETGQDNDLYGRGNASQLIVQALIANAGSGMSDAF